MTSRQPLRCRFAAIALLLAVSLSGSTYASEESKSDEERHSVKTFFKHLGQDEAQIWSAPFKKESWKSPAPYLLIGGTGLAFTLDGGPAESLRENPDLSGFNDIMASPAVDTLVAGYPLIALAAGKAMGNERVVDYGWKAGEAVIDSFAVALTLKAVTARKRPHNGDTYGFWKGGNSFPSGHSTAAWALASLTVKHFPEKRWIPWVAYPLAGLVSFSRVSSGHHYFSDVAAGSILGFCIGSYVVD